MSPYRLQGAAAVESSRDREQVSAPRPDRPHSAPEGPDAHGEESHEVRFFSRLLFTGPPEPWSSQEDWLLTRSTVGTRSCVCPCWSAGRCCRGRVSHTGPTQRTGSAGTFCSRTAECAAPHEGHIHDNCLPHRSFRSLTLHDDCVRSLHTHVVHGVLNTMLHKDQRIHITRVHFIVLLHVQQSGRDAAHPICTYSLYI